MTSLGRSRQVAALFVFALLLALVVSGCGQDASTSASVAAPVAEPGTGDDALAQAFADRTSGIEVHGQGTVQRVLSDDNDGDRHQRFIVELASGQTILIAHNVDVAPRVPGLQAGDAVSFKGQYEWSQQGGTVHWTHYDPDGSHAAGWVKHRGTTYQ